MSASLLPDRSSRTSASALHPTERTRSSLRENGAPAKRRAAMTRSASSSRPRFAQVQRAPGEDRLFRVAYGDGELEFMLQPWFDVEVAPPAQPIDKQYDIVIAGIGKPDDADLTQALRAAAYLRLAKAPAVRDGGVLIIAAQLEDGEGDDTVEITSLVENCLVVIAASESPEIVRIANLRAAVDVEEALDIAYEHIGRPQRASVLLVPRAQQRSTS